MRTDPPVIIPFGRSSLEGSELGADAPGRKGVALAADVGNGRPRRLPRRRERAGAGLQRSLG